MEQKVGKGAITLILSGFICKIFGAFFRLPLTNIIGIQGIGVFQMVMSLYSLMLVLISGGVTNSLAKLVASSRAYGDERRIFALKRTAFLFSTILGVVIGLFFIVFGKQIALLQGIENDGWSSYFLLIILLPLGGAIGVYRGIIQGYENMTPTAISQILEQSIKFAAGLLFAYIFGKNGFSRGVFGAFLGITLSEFIAFFYLFIVVKTKYKTSKSHENVRKIFFSAALPLSFASAINPLTNAIESVSIVSLLSLAGIAVERATILYGLQTGVVGALMHFPLIISLSVAMALLPKLSYLFGTNDTESQREIISKSFDYMWFFLVPITIGIISVSGVLYPLIYHGIISDYMEIVYNLTIVSGFSIILSAIMQFSLAILQAKGFFTESMIFSVIAGVFKILTLFILARINVVNIFAISISNIVFNSTVCICALIKLKDLVRVGAFEFLLPLLSSGIMFLCVKIFLSLFTGVWGLLLSIIFGALIYFVVAFPLTFEIGRKFLSKIKLKRRNVC